MKKLIKMLCLTLAAVTTISLAACGKKNNNNGDDFGDDTSNSPRITIAASARWPRGLPG